MSYWCLGGVAGVNIIWVPLKGINGDCIGITIRIHARTLPKHQEVKMLS